MSKRGEPWTADEHDRMLEGLRGGMSFEQVARRHERSVKAIQWRFGAHCQRLTPAKTIEQIAKEFGQPPDRIEEIMVEIRSQKQQHQPSIQQQPTSSSIDDVLQKHTKLLKKILLGQQEIVAEIEKLKKKHKSAP